MEYIKDGSILKGKEMEKVDLIGTTDNYTKVIGVKVRNMVRECGKAHQGIVTKDSGTKDVSMEKASIVTKQAPTKEIS